MESSVDPTRVVKLNVYPIKSCKAVDVSEIEFDAFGVVGDRRFMMIDGNHRYLSQRQFGIMTTVVAKLVVENGEQFFSISAPSVSWELKIKPITDGPRIDAHLWDCKVRMIDQGEEAARWCNELIGPDGKGAIRLVATSTDGTGNETGQTSLSGEEYQRFVDNIPKNLKERVSDIQVGLANESPVSLVSLESLADLNEKMTQNGVGRVGLDRFRMNIEVSGCSRPFEEDEWLLVRIGEIPFLVYEYCERCKQTSVNQETGVLDKTGPVDILRKYRAPKGPAHAKFGQHLIPLQRCGKVRVGDYVQIIERKKF